MGLLLGLDTLVSQAFGARQIDDCHRWLSHGALLALLLTPPLLLTCGAIYLAIPSLGFHAEVQPLLRDYFGVVLWSSPFLLLYAAFRRYLQGIHIVTPVMAALVSANLVNAVVNWVLIYGHFGLPAMGVSGAAWATVLSRFYMAGFLLIAIVRHDKWQTRDLSKAWRFEWSWLRRLLALGFPAASTVALEVGVFAAATALAGKLAPVSAASHQIALNIAALAFMVPLGLSSAGAVRVGHAVGARDPARASAAGWTAILLGLAFMSVAAALFLLIPRTLIGFFSRDAAVLALGSSLLFVGAIFQLFDGLQIVTTGVLRGLGDTRTPMITNLVRALAVRSARRLHALLRLRLWRHRAVGWLLDRPDHRRRGPVVCLESTNSPVAKNSVGFQLPVHRSKGSQRFGRTATNPFELTTGH